MPKIITKKDAIKNVAKASRESNPEVIEGEIKKLASENLNTSRLMLGEQGYLGLAEIVGQIYEQSKYELRGHQAIQTFHQMSMDPVIGAAMNAIDVMIAQVPWRFEAPHDASDEAKNAAEFLNHCKDNMVRQTFAEFINDIGSYRTYGFHIAEKVFTKVTKGKWAGKYKWKRIPGRSQRSIYRWEYDKDTKDLLGVWQNLANVPTSITANNSNLAYIDRNKFLLFRYDPKRDNPEGNSPLIKAWISWKYKQFLEELETISFSKDMSGILHIQVDINFLQRAEANPDGPEAKTLLNIKKNAANFHKGDQSFIMSPLGYTHEGKDSFKVTLLGIEGSGKKDSIDVAIKRKQTEILMIYLADVLQLGNQSHGSYSLADAKTNLLGHAVEHHLKIISDVFNNDLIPQTLAINGWALPEEEMPKAVYGDIESVDQDVFSSFIQRVAAVNFLPLSQELFNEVLEVGGFKYRIPEGTSDAEFRKMLPMNETGAAEGMQSGTGNGTSKKAAKRDNSTANKSN